jgi:hypothetical protein
LLSRLASAGLSPSRLGLVGPTLALLQARLAGLAEL